MLIGFDYIYNKYDMKINGVVHVGAHYGEEIDQYLEKDITKIICFEPLDENLKVLKNLHQDKNILIFPYALGEEEKEVSMYVSDNNAESSSILKPKKHLENHPNVIFDKEQNGIKMKTMNSFKNEIIGCNYLSMDVQGYEYQVLLGASDVLNQFDFIYCEVNRDETYENNYLIDEIDSLLSKYNFVRSETDWAGGIWGDALYVKMVKN